MAALMYQSVQCRARQCQSNAVDKKRRCRCLVRNVIPFDVAGTSVFDCVDERTARNVGLSLSGICCLCVAAERTERATITSLRSICPKPNGRGREPTIAARALVLFTL